MKQIIIIRKDLNMRKGKMAAQAAHASVAVVRDAFENILHATNNNSVDGYVNYMDFLDWVDGQQTKIVVGVDSEQELFDIHSKAKASYLPCSLILDAAYTEFDKPTYTAVAIGPAKSELIDPITGKLKLL